MMIPELFLIVTSAPDSAVPVKVGVVVFTCALAAGVLRVGVLGAVVSIVNDLLAPEVILLA